MSEATLLKSFDLLATAPGGVSRLRELVLTLAVQGKLVPQDPNDEPASALLEVIRIERGGLAAAGKVKRDVLYPAVDKDEMPFSRPDGWEFCRLGNLILSIKSGGTPSKQNPSFWNGDIPWASVKDLGFGDPLIKTQDKITKAGLEDGSCLAEAGSILICTRMGLGKIGLALIDVAINQDLKAVRLGSGVNPQYFIEWFKTLAIVGSGMTVAGIKQDELLNFCVPLPPPAEQTRIVARVEELMKLCDTLEQNGRLADEQHARLTSTLFDALTASESAHALAENWQRVAENFELLLDRPEAVDALEQTILQLAVRGLLVPQDPQDEPASELLKKIRLEKDRLIAEGKIKRDKLLAEVSEEDQPFALPQGWEWVRLGTACKKITDGTHHSPASFPSGDFMYLSAKNIKSWGVDVSSATFVPKAVHDEIYARCDPEPGDILYIKDGATTGVLTINTIREPFSLLSSVGVIKPSCGLTSDYMSLAMQSPFFYQAMRDDMAGVAITRVTLSKLGNAKFPIPPLAEQSRIVARVAVLRHLCADLRKSLAASQSVQSKLAESLVAEVV